jgi:hypothetical protein
MNLYRIDCIVVSAYNSEANSMMRCRHKSLIDELMKMINEDLKK